MTLVPFLITLALFVAVFYFFMIRPIRHREKKHDQMVLELQKGDTVITAGGMYGEVDSIDEDSIVLKVESGAKIRVTKGGVLALRDEE
ncbi:MAG: preprotein translocase subunit YajC [Chloroflexi bacterium]|nr:preprotein translocase subunit YajC [Chloroflexota bacterium]